MQATIPEVEKLGHNYDAEPLGQFAPSLKTREKVITKISEEAAQIVENQNEVKHMKAFLTVKSSC